MNTEVFDKTRVKGFLHAKGRIMVNGDGQEVILRGLGAGNWNNPEGFMIGAFSDFQVPVKKVNAPIGRMDRGRSFSALIRELCGTKYEAEFWPQWFRNHLGAADIRQMADWGLNSVRLPLDARTLLYEEPGIQFNEDTFAMLDDVLAWCEKYGIYAILDLHGAVGGQSALPCDDGVDGMPHLFYDEESWERTMVLCEELAKRYADRTIVGAYDLINEPLSGPVWEEYIPKLKEFYHELVERMRKFDKNHLLLLNGHVFSSRVDMFNGDFDPECHNWGLAIHNYGALPQYDLFAASVSKGAELDIPVWFGEGGGSPAWMTAMYELSVEYHIGFNVWCYKTADNGLMDRCFAAHRLPDEWPMVISYARDGGVRPSYAHAQKIFDEYLELIKYENCRISDTGICHMLRRPGCTVPAVAYDDVLEDGTKAFSGNFPYGNGFGYRLGDGMQIVTEENYCSKLGVIGPQDAAGDWEHYELVLSAGDHASYTLRDSQADSSVEIIYRGDAENAVLRVLADAGDGRERREIFVGAVNGGTAEGGVMANANVSGADGAGAKGAGGGELGGAELGGTAGLRCLKISLGTAARTVRVIVEAVQGRVVLKRLDYK